MYGIIIAVVFAEHKGVKLINKTYFVDCGYFVLIFFFFFFKYIYIYIGLSNALILLIGLKHVFGKDHVTRQSRGGCGKWARKSRSS